MVRAAQRLLIFCFPLFALGQAATVPHDISGSYAFMRHGEEVQVNIEPGEVSGHINAYGASDTDRDLLLGYFFKQAKWDADTLTFSTRTVHGTYYAFVGHVERGKGKRPSDEGYLQIVGKLTRFREDEKYQVATDESDVLWPSNEQGLSGDWATSTGNDDH